MSGQQESRKREFVLDEERHVDLALLVAETNAISSTHFVTKTLLCNPLAIINPHYHPVYKISMLFITKIGFSHKSQATRVIRPCLFNPKQSQINSKDEFTICTTHGNSGFLRLADVRNKNGYTCVPKGISFEVVIHKFNDCVLEFPPSHRSISSLDNEDDGTRFPCQNLNTWYFSGHYFKYYYLCNEVIDLKDDIYMYRDRPYCSVECRSIQNEKAERLMKATLMKKQY